MDGHGQRREKGKEAKKRSKPSQLLTYQLRSLNQAGRGSKGKEDMDGSGQWQEGDKEAEKRSKLPAINEDQNS